MAPAEKFGASLPTTSAAKFAAASFTPACSIWIVSPPIAFIFEWNSSARTPSPRSTRLAPAFLRTTLLLVARGLQDQEIARLTQPSRSSCLLARRLPQPRARRL